MSKEGIAYKYLLNSASTTDLLSLCEPGLRALLAAETMLDGQFSADQQRQVLEGAVDLTFACRDETGRETLLRLIEERIKADFIVSLATFAGLQDEARDSVLRHYQSNPKTLESFLAWKQVDSQIVGAVNNISGNVSPKRALRYYQLKGVRDILFTLEDKKRCLYQAPTGAGKTRTAMSVISRHFIKHGPTKVLWLASTTELVDQACRAFREEWENTGDTDAVLYGWRGGGAKFNPVSATNKNSMLVASVQLLSQLQEEISALTGQVSLIVFDEAHQSLAPTYQNIINRLLEDKNCKLLGLSATPVRTESEKASRDLAEMYGLNRISIYSGNQNPIEFLVNNGFLAKTHFKKFEFNLKGLPKPKPGSEDYNRELLEWLGNNKERNIAIANFVKDTIDQGRKRILVFTPTIVSAQYCALVLHVLHEIDLSYSVSSQTSRSLREGILAKFASADPEPMAIFNCQVLTTGFDAPKTDAVVVARPTKSPTLYAQMIGRCLRGPQSQGTEDAYIYNFADQNLEGYNHLIQLFESFQSAWD